jgi:hypothetical protein
MKNIINVINKFGQRAFSTNPSLRSPEKIYNNAAQEKLQILLDNKGKTGIYKWKNNLNNKFYVGSGFNLYSRLQHYYSSEFMKGALKRSKSIIYSTILKHGLENFSLSILEYCSPDKLLEREQYYIDLLEPEYNILTKAGSSLGYKHLQETKAKISASLNAYQASNPNCIKIEVSDLANNTKTIYPSLGSAARALNINQKTISNYFSRNQKKPYKGRYIFTKIDT